jgi:hypothetical protein
MRLHKGLEAMSIKSEVPLHTTVGDTIIAVSDEQFTEGFEAGYLYFRLAHRGTPLSEQHIYRTWMEMLLHPRFTDRWKAGYLLGWAHALQEPYLPRLPEQRAEVTPAMLLGIMPPSFPVAPTTAEAAVAGTAEEAPR